MSPANPFESELHSQALEVAQNIHDHLTPRTSSYAEIWLDGEKTSIGEQLNPSMGRPTFRGNSKLLWHFHQETMLMSFQIV